MDWNDIIKQMPVLLKELQRAPLVNRSDMQKACHFMSGVYVFYEGAKPMYVGRTKKYISKRVFMHGRAGSHHNQSSFAFLLAKTEAIQKHIDIVKTRKILERDKKFNAIFSKQKERIRNMQVRAIQISDSQVQAIFEIYASKILRTPYNDFDTH